MDDTEAAPPIPPYTVEELYTAVMKKPRKVPKMKRKLHQYLLIQGKKTNFSGHKIK